MRASRPLLIIAGWLSIAVALFQVVITFSIPWSKYFGAPPSLVVNPPLLYVTGVVAGIIFLVFGLYAFSGTGTLRRLPFIRTGLVVITTLYVLRGLLLIPESLAFYNRRSFGLPPQALWSSAVSLVIGIFYLAGLMGSWKNFSDRRRSQAQGGQQK